MPGNKQWNPEWTAKYAAIRRAKRLKRLGIIAEGATELHGSTIRTITVMVGGEPVELLNGAEVRRAMKLGLTRITDWQGVRAIPPPFLIAGMRYFTANQVALLEQLASMNAQGASNAKLAERDAFIRQLWREWWE